MNTSKDQLDRLLREAAQARRSVPAEPIESPRAAWLLASIQRQDTVPPNVLRVLRQGLAAACITMIAAGFLAVREIRQHRSGFMSITEAAKSQIAISFVP